MAQNIEFYLHPPSPRLEEDSQSSCTLPPVSTLLQPNDDDDDIPISPIADLPSIIIPSPSLSYLEPVEPNTDTSSSPSLSPFMNSLSLDSPPQLSSPQISPYCNLLLPPPVNTRRYRSLSNASANSPTDFTINRRLSDPPVYCQDEKTTSISTNTTVKRKRGRPSNASRQTIQNENWTFVTPTVWDVKHKDTIIDSPGTPTSLTSEVGDHHDDFMVLHWPINDNKDGQQQQQQQQQQNIFTNTTMDTTLSIPKKKRGRKPKMQLEGNFCFVWRDLTAPRSSNKKKLSSTTTTNQKDM
ncbi:uncharacterized protein BX663DRAFT_520463 [Cokeromyces recurvatus]|uniref:uncharacterized protein n=1 Tax=Cokeromyces recurvatus TaxID=90255 RepID=UPI00221F142C|nr:uncharacterized protein BX663DRAFT_520463 [Cokeromyces recurvatus]KAI7899562.1 hypothetical protein BX663DRAFT_520463 [Cokeromyces recurvatus]